jgi:hypothetical protein
MPTLWRGYQYSLGVQYPQRLAHGHAAHTQTCRKGSFVETFSGHKITDRNARND